jgi:hypothetical protein
MWPPILHMLHMAEPGCELWSASQAPHCLWLEKLAELYLTRLLINMKVWPLCNCYCWWLFFLSLMAEENTETFLEIYLTALFQNTVGLCSQLTDAESLMNQQTEPACVLYVWAIIFVICLVASLPLTDVSWTFQHPQDPRSPASDCPSSLGQPTKALAFSWWLRHPLHSFRNSDTIMRLVIPETVPEFTGYPVPSEPDQNVTLTGHSQVFWDLEFSVAVPLR